MLQPSLLDDANGEYPGFDDKIRKVQAGHHKYANFSNWDTYRTSAPLLALLAPDRASDMAASLLQDTLAAISTGRPDTMLRVLEVKAAAAETALEVTDIAMRVCGGAAFRKEAGIERLFRDARAASVMAPTSDVLYDFIGKALTGLPLF